MQPMHNATDATSKTLRNGMPINDEVLCTVGNENDNELLHNDPGIAIQSEGTANYCALHLSFYNAHAKWVSL